jgi:tripartite-type tricarboxylate transporter receptor subunit TctC
MIRPYAYLAICLVSWVGLPAAAQYPAKPVHLIVPFAVGGTADLAARIISQPLSQALGQPIIVENRPGADGAIAGEAVAKSTPDGYTLFFATNTPLNATPTLRKSPPYDPLTDFTAISMILKFGFFLVVHESVPARTVTELLEYVRANPGKLNYGTGNSTAILATAQLKQLYGLDIVHVPYKGDAPAVTDLVAGRVHLMFVTGTALPYVKEGRLRALATLLPTRSPLLPEVPTMEEAGVPNLSIVPWGGLFGPAKLPKDVVNRLAREMKAVLAQSEVRDGLARMALEARSSSPEEMTVLLKDQLETWRRTIQEVGIVRD